MSAQNQEGNLWDFHDDLCWDAEESQDESDGSSCTVIDKNDIPDKIVVFSAKYVKEKPSNYYVVPNDWGESVTPGYSKAHGMLTLEGKKLAKDTLFKIVMKVNKKLPSELHVLRMRPLQILLMFDSWEEYGNFGNYILEGKVDLGQDHRIIALEPAVFGPLPRVSVTVTSNKKDGLFNSLEAAIAQWSGFPYLTMVYDSQGASTLPEDHIPHLSFVLLFEGICQKKAQKVLDVLAKPPWKKISLMPEVQSALHPGASFYLNTFGGPNIGVSTGRPTSGLQILLFVQKKDNFEQMTKFYRQLLGSPEGEAHIQSKGEVRISVFPISNKCELMLAFFPGFAARTSPELELVVKVQELSKIAEFGLATIGSKITDPEGNTIVPMMYKIDA